jgi:hypothetical protein
MLDRRTFETAAIETGVRKVKSEPVAMIDVERVSGVVSIDLVSQSVKLAMDASEARQLALMILNQLPVPDLETAVHELTGIQVRIERTPKT